MRVGRCVRAHARIGGGDTGPPLLPLLPLLGSAQALNARGNRTLTAEYNTYCDPEAAHICLASFPTSTMVGWDLTLKWVVGDARARPGAMLGCLRPWPLVGVRR